MSAATHLPPRWRERLAGLMLFPANDANLALLDAWARAEGGTANYNPLNTTEPMNGAWDYNTAGVKNYPTPIHGIAATALTLQLAPYRGLWSALQAGKLTAVELVEQHRAAFDTWGTGAANILRILQT